MASRKFFFFSGSKMTESLRSSLSSADSPARSGGRARLGALSSSSRRSRVSSRIPFVSWKSAFRSASISARSRRPASARNALRPCRPSRSARCVSRAPASHSSCPAARAWASLRWPWRSQAAPCSPRQYRRTCGGAAAAAAARVSPTMSAGPQLPFLPLPPRLRGGRPHAARTCSSRSSSSRRARSLASPGGSSEWCSRGAPGARAVPARPGGGARAAAGPSARLTSQTSPSTPAASRPPSRSSASSAMATAAW